MEWIQEDGEDVLLDVSSFLLLELVGEEQQVVSERHQEVLSGVDGERLDGIALAALTGPLDQSRGESDLLCCQKCQLISRLLLQYIYSTCAVRTNKSS